MGREIFCADALPWLAAFKPAEPTAFTCSPPDAAECGFTVEQWRPWFVEAVRLTLRATSPGCPALFYTTDRKADGQWHSKPHLIMQAADLEGVPMLFHKIALRRAVGACDIHRPTYSHITAFGHCKPGAASPDVFERGQMIYDNSVGMAAALFMVRYAMRYSPRVCNPFCGKGTLPALVDALGGHGIGVDILPEQAEAARRLVLQVGHIPAE